jgi:hypothetical protein
MFLVASLYLILNMFIFRHDEVSKYLCGLGATLVLDENEAGIKMCQVFSDLIKLEKPA